MIPTGRIHESETQRVETGVAPLTISPKDPLGIAASCPLKFRLCKAPKEDFPQRDIHQGTQEVFH